MRKPIAAANWKMNGDFSLLDDFAQANITSDKCETIFALPSVLLDRAQKLGLNALAGQDVSAQVKGAFTGEISASMLKMLGCQYCIIGHSERRQYHYEDEALLIEKWRRLKEAEITPIYCIGELQAEYDAHATQQALERQLRPILEENLVDHKTIIAYEPVWAIGTGKAATPDYAQHVHQMIRQIVAQNYASIAPAMRLLYGGSVKPDNAGLLICQADIDGFLIGGASLDVGLFTKIIETMK